MKTMDEIYGEMMEAFSSRTGLAVSQSGDLAVRMQAVAAQLHALYLQGEWTRRQCFPQSAEGEYLDAHGQLRGVSRREATRAQGTLRFYSDGEHTAPLDIPLGTVAMTAGLVRFETTQEAALPVGESWVDVPAQAAQAGAAGNAAARSVVTMAVAPAGVTECTNPQPFTGGMDREEDEEFRARVLETYARPSNGANAAFYAQTAMAFEGVAAVQVLPRSRGVGTVDVVVAAPAGTPEEELLEEIRQTFDTAREIAVDVEVLPPETAQVDVTVTLTAAAGRDGEAVAQQVRQTLLDYFDGTLLGKSVLRAKLGSLIFAVDGVENYVLSAPAQDVAGEEGVLPVLGTLQVEVGP